MQSCFRKVTSVRRVFHPHTIRFFSATRPCSGLDEFFPPGVLDEGKFVEEDPRYGRSWKKSDLAIKSNTDLHKLWYVLLKERNMLATLRHECERLGRPCPGPDRYVKVIKSMNKKAAAVPGDLPMKIIAEFCDELSRPLTHLIN